MNELLTMQEAADFLKVGYSTFRKMRRDERIPTVHLSSSRRGLRFRRADLEMFVTSKTSPEDEGDLLMQYKETSDV